MSIMCALVPSEYRNCIFRTSLRTARNFSPARKVLSMTAPSETRLSLVRTNAGPLPGFTCWNSWTRKMVPSTSMWLPFLNWLVLITLITPPAGGIQSVAVRREVSPREGSGSHVTGGGMRLWYWHSLVTEVIEMSGHRLRHPLFDLLSRTAQGDHTIDVRGVRAPAAVVGSLVDHQVFLHRSSFSPEARRIEASVPARTVSESLPATVRARRPSGLCQVSCEPA